MTDARRERIHFGLALAGVILGIVLGTRCAHADELPMPAPLHSFGPWNAEASALLGGPTRLGIVLHPATHGRLLDAALRLQAVEAERDALAEERDALRVELAASKAETAAMARAHEAALKSTMLARTETNVAKGKAGRRGKGIAWGFAIGVLTGVAAGRM